MKWEDVLPTNVAIAQRKFEKRATIINMRKNGISAKKIADLFGMSISNVYAQAHEHVSCEGLYNTGVRNNRLKELSPLERYLIDDKDIRVLATFIRRL